MKIQNKGISLKLKFILLYASMITLLALAMIFWVKLSFEEYVRNAEISRLSSYVMPVLKAEAKNYYTSRDDDAFKRAILDIKRTNPMVISIFITENGEYAGGENESVFKSVLQNSNIQFSQAGMIEGSSDIAVGNKEQVLVYSKGELDPYMLFFTFSRDVIKERMNNLVLKVSFVIGIVSLVIMILGAAFLHLLVSPVEKVAKDAERLSLGDMKIKLKGGSISEVGRLYRSLSRLRESILYSLKRLDMR